MITKMNQVKDFSDFEKGLTQKKNRKLVVIASVLAALFLTVVLWAAWPKGNQEPSNKNKHDRKTQHKLKSTAAQKSLQKPTSPMNQNTPMAESFIPSLVKHKFRFKNDPAKNLEYHRKESKRFRGLHPEKVPVVIEKAHCSMAPQFRHNNKLFMVSNKSTVSHVIKQIQKILNYSVPLKLYVNGKRLNDDEIFCAVYNRLKDEDGFLYLLYI